MMFTRRTLAAGLVAALGLASAPAAQPIEMVMTNEIATTHWSAKLMDEFAETIRERTDGRIEPRVFHAATLFRDRDAVGAIGTGAVHMVWPVSVQLEAIAPEYGVINLPFAIDDDLMLTDGAAEALAEMLSGFVADRGLRVMGLMRAADMIFIYRDREITEPAALRGDRIRLTGGRVLQALMRELNANPITMSASEMSTALMQGAIDGIFTSAGGWQMVGVNAAGVATHVPGLSVLSYTVVVDDAWLNGLPEDLRAIVVDTTEEFLAEQWANGLQSDKETLQRMLDAGGRLVVIEGEELEAFRELALKASALFTDEHPEVWAEFQEKVARFR